MTGCGDEADGGTIMFDPIGGGEAPPWLGVERE